MNYDNYLNIILEMVANVVTNIQVDTLRVRVALMTFSDAPKVEFYFNTYVSGSEIGRAIRQASYGGSKANLADALSVLRTDVFSAANGHRTDPNITSVAVIITDNVSTNRTATLMEAQKARDAGINIVTLGIGTYLDEYELSAVASYPYRTNMIIRNTVKALQGKDFENSIQRLVCNNDGSCSGQAICGNSGTCMESFNEFMCSCSSGRTGRFCNISCTNAADVVFALDVSRSLGLASFQNSTNFVARIVQNLRIGDNSFDPMVSRVGILTFGSTAEMQFPLNKYSDMKKLLQATNVPYAAESTTNLAQAISYARDVMFTPANGDRPEIPNYLVIVTDGPSTNSTAAWQESIWTRAQGINIMTIGVGPYISLPELVGVASAPDSSNVILIPDSASFSDAAVNNVSANICNNMDRCMQTANCQNGATCKNTMGGYSCGPCPPSFTGAMCERRCTGKIDLIFMLDSAGTVHYERFQNLTNFAISVVNQMEVGPNQTRVALVYWGGEGYVGFYLNQYSTKQDVIQAIRNTPYLGNKTNTASAFRVLRRQILVEENGDRRDAENFVIFVANGDATVDPSLTIAEAIQSRLNGNHMITVGVEPGMQKSLEMEAITSFPRESNFFFAPSFRALPNVTDGVVAATCNSTDLCLSNPCKNGGRCVSGYNLYRCECPIGFTGVNCQRRCTRQMDIVFILDVSGSVEEEYRTSVAFTRTVVAGLDVASGAVRIGAIAFSTAINGQFFMNQNIGKQSGVINSLDFYYVGGTTNTPLALTEVRNNHFTSSRGDRPGVDNIAILVTDGYSNVNEAQTVPLSEQLRNNGVTFYCVAVGESPQMSEVNDMVSQPTDDHVVRLLMDSNMNDVADTLLDKLCPPNQ